ncbi:MAG: helix-turn-helix domain-containing protein [Acidimicrobiia bacterium]
MATSRPRFLTPAEVAELLRVSPMTVYRLIKAGEIRAARIGRSFRIREQDVDAYLQARFDDVG